MTNQEMKLLHERIKKEDPKLLVLMEKCFDAGVLSGKESAQRIWVGLTDEEAEELRIEKEFDKWGISEGAFKYAVRDIEAELKERNK